MWILISILFLLLFLLSMPVSISVEYREELTLKVQYLFFHLGILPTSEKEESQDKPRKKEKKQKEQKETQIKQKKKWTLDSVLEILELIKQALNSLRNPLGWFLRTLRYRDIWLNVLVCREDAHQTALRYGQVQAIFHSVFSLLQHCIDISTTEIRINANFIGEEEHISGGGKIKLRPLCALIFLFWFVGSFGVGYLKRKYKESQLQKELKQKQKSDI